MQAQAASASAAAQVHGLAATVQPLERASMAALAGDCSLKLGCKNEPVDHSGTGSA